MPMFWSRRLPLPTNIDLLKTGDELFFVCVELAPSYVVPGVDPTKWVKAEIGLAVFFKEYHRATIRQVRLVGQVIAALGYMAEIMECYDALEMCSALLEEMGFAEEYLGIWRDRRRKWKWTGDVEKEVKVVFKEFKKLTRGLRSRGL